MFDSDPDDCAPEGWTDTHGGSCAGYLKKGWCDYDYTDYANNGYHSVHCVECGCGKLTEAPAGNHVIFKNGLAKLTSLQLRRLKS